MRTVLKGGRIYCQSGNFREGDIAVANGEIVAVGAGVSSDNAEVIQCDGKIIIPGFADVHVHLREPGFSYKETIATGTAAAARGGYTAVCAMPNLNPPPDSEKGLAVQLELITQKAAVKVYPYGCITVGQRGGGALTRMPELRRQGAVAFSDDGKGVQREEDMRRAMELAAANGLLIAAHCEDESLLAGGYIHAGGYAAAHGHRGICSRSEWGQVERDLGLAEETGCRYHVCHISCRETVELIRRAKARGVRVTCETAPHYLTLCDSDLQEDGRFKMNPPLRSRDDKEALLEGIEDGTIDVIATDHAPHGTEEKSRGLADSAMGIVGLETAFPVLYTALVVGGIITLERLVELMSVNPRRIFALEGGSLAVGEPADIAVLDIHSSYRIDPDSFLSQGRATPFGGWQVQGENIMTMVNGRIVYVKSV